MPVVNDSAISYCLNFLCFCKSEKAACGIKSYKEVFKPFHQFCNKAVTKEMLDCYVILVTKRALLHI